MKQTAVEWLIENIPDLGKYIPFGVSMELHAKFQQALELEKQQIENAWKSGDTNGRIGILKTKEQYYSETYKNETE
jgi:hypothetical protein